MSAVPVTIVGIETRSDGTSENVTIVGMASLTGLGVGGGPIMPPPGQPGHPGPILPPGGPGHPAHPIAPGGGPHPEHPIAPGGPPLHPEHPIIIPVPPGAPNVPPPGSPPVIVGGTQPVNPMTPPSAVVIEYPGIGKVVVPQPTQTGGPAPV